ncbi:hypothetical protein BDV95DRAFT_669115 [Massariosphaeria phaeospora]|uniref:DUF6604 domain-containing protein n=1 Tax=Massariosphaeria phaeospora TaxID=100035 RepID=A0A7C8I627_9PLEO|nr:hypothetical protein BDV95DRAFT_669115 [Massariosphaeria phaeospora]
MVSHAGMSDHDRMKHRTDRVKCYLVETTKLVANGPKMKNTCGQDLSAVPIDNLQIRVFVQCARLIANDDHHSGFIPKHIWDYLKEAIVLRTKENTSWEPFVRSNPAAKEESEKHQAFIEVLQEILRMLKSGEQRYRARARKLAGPDPELAQAPKTELFGVDAISKEVEEEESILDPVSSKLNESSAFMYTAVKAVDMGAFTELLNFLTSINQLEKDVLISWGLCSNGSLSVPACAIISNFAYHLLEHQITRYELLTKTPEYDVSEHAASGILRAIEGVYQSFINSMPDADEDANAEQWRLAYMIFQPTVRITTIMKRLALEDTPSGRAMLENTALPDPYDGVCSNSPAFRYDYHYRWKFRTAEIFFREYNRLRELEKTTKIQCLTYGDRLTLSMPYHIEGGKRSTWEPVALDFLIEILAVRKGNCHLPSTREIANYTKARVGLLQKVHEETPEEFNKALRIANDFVLRDSLKDIGSASNVPDFFHITANPVFAGILSYGMLDNLHNGISQLEKKEPVATAVLHVYHALIKAKKLQKTWPDMEYLLLTQDPYFIFSRQTPPPTWTSSIVSAKIVLHENSSTKVFEPGPFRKVIRKYNLDSSLENFRELQRFVLAYMKARASTGITQSGKQPHEKLDRDEDSDLAAYMLRIAQFYKENIGDIVSEDLRDPEPWSFIVPLTELMHSQDFNLHFDVAGVYNICRPLVDGIADVYMLQAKGRKYSKAQDGPAYTYVPIWMELAQQAESSDDLLTPIIKRLDNHIAKYGRAIIETSERLSSQKMRSF